MTRQELKTLLANPSGLDTGRLSDLIALSEEYPYCGAFHRLILIALYRNGDLRYASELHKRIFSVPDPEELFLTLSGHGADDTARDDAKARTERAEESGGDAFSIIENFLEDHPEDTSEIESLLGEEERPEEVEASTETPPAPQESTSEIISDFLSKGPEAEVIPPLEERRETEGAVGEKESPGEDDYLTETLARIYIRQEKYDRALRIFRTLNLKYPKKSGYFAEQIAYLERALRALGGANGRSS